MVPKLYNDAFEVREGFRAVLFRMVPKQQWLNTYQAYRFRAVLFRMVPKRLVVKVSLFPRFRAVLFRMVPKRLVVKVSLFPRFRAVLFRMVPKPSLTDFAMLSVLELCCFEWFQNLWSMANEKASRFRAVLFRMVPKLWLLNMNTPKPHLVRHWVG